ncbi:hypothetical protein PInf_005812 [Phytophthora infestans]|nr:hypothetical protein PInf_005812 [Phytophthora infestans]
MTALKDPGKAKPPDPAPRQADAMMANPSGRQRREVTEQGSSAFSPDSIVPETPASTQEDDAEMEEPKPEERNSDQKTTTKERSEHARPAPVATTPRVSPEPSESTPLRADPPEGVSDASPGVSTDAPAVEPFEMFEAVVAEMKSFPAETARTAWTSTVAELYALAHAKVPIDENLLPSGKRRYPRLKGDEKTLLLKLF